MSICDDHYPDDKPDLSKSLSRFNAPYWATVYGIMAKLEASEWKVLVALYTFLPNVYPGKGRIEHLSGVSESSVKRARKRLKELGLIWFQDDQRGGDPRANTSTHYTIADIRRPEILANVLARMDGSAAVGVTSVSHGVTPVSPHGVHGEPPTGFLVTPQGVQDDPRTGVTMNPKVLNTSTQPSTQLKPPAAFGLTGAVAPAGGSCCCRTFAVAGTAG